MAALQADGDNVHRMVRLLGQKLAVKLVAVRYLGIVLDAVLLKANGQIAEAVIGVHHVGNGCIIFAHAVYPMPKKLRSFAVWQRYKDCRYLSEGRDCVWVGVLKNTFF